MNSSFSFGDGGVGTRKVNGMEWFRGREGEYVLSELVGGDKGTGGYTTVRLLESLYMKSY